MLQSANLLGDLKRQCRRPALEDSPVCRLLNALPDLDLGGLLDRGQINDSMNGLTDGVPGLSEELVSGVQPGSSDDPSDVLGVAT